MESRQEINEIIIPEYCGKILQGNFSKELKKKVTDSISAFQAYEKTGVPTIPYIAAWKEEDNVIWYEFVGARLVGIFKCKKDEVADIFRKSVVARRVYKYPYIDGGVYKETLEEKELNEARENLRIETEITGLIEAVYKISLPQNRIMWVKDQARIEKFPIDRLSISLGCLTVVTKEMALEDKCENLISGFSNAMEEVKNP